MNYAMLTTLIPEDQDREYREKSRNNMQDAANALQWNLYRGFCQNLGRNIPVINVLPVGSYPQYYADAFVRQRTFRGNCTSVGFCNIKLIRNGAKARALGAALERWCRETEGEKTLFLYTLSNPMLRAAWTAKKKHPELRVCAIVADLPQMSSLSSNTNILRKTFTKLTSADTMEILPAVDCFVLLTEHMAAYLGLTQPYMVMEGIAPEPQPISKVKSSDGLRIMYSGTLHRKFGVLHLVEAFRKLPNSDCRLVLCGVGDSEAEICRAAQEDERIQFLGQLSRSEVLRLQTEAAVLVNPRRNNEEFTKYSFPSKTMEYLASGVPVVAYKLDGIPAEYDAYLNYPRDDTPQALAETLGALCEMDAASRALLGKQGRAFVLGEKNCVVQTGKILEFMKGQA